MGSRLAKRNSCPPKMTKETSRKKMGKTHHQPRVYIYIYNKKEKKKEVNTKFVITIIAF